jgi:hypothetical protein
MILIAAEIHWLNIVGNVAAMILSIVAIIFAYRNTKLTLDSKKREEKRSEIYKKLNDFYQPFYQLRRKSEILYEAFSEKFKNTSSVDNFKTLTYLLNGGEFEGNEAVLLKEIIDIGEKCESLIHEKAGLIDQADLRDIWFPKATTHYMIMRQAAKGTLKGQPSKFEKYTFPSELDKLIKERIDFLQKELEELSKI